MIRESFMFCAWMTWMKGVFGLAMNNDYSPIFASSMAVLGITAAELMITDETFGTTRIVLLLVLLTVLLNTIYGIMKSLTKQKIIFSRASRHPFQSKEYNVFFQRSQRYKFDAKRLKFVFFKFITFLGYLFFAQKLLDGGGGFLDFTTEFAVKIPVAFFWYYEFKSLGDNSEFIYGKKASIFKIVEMMFEPKISQIFGSKTPADGMNSDIQMDPREYEIEEEEKKQQQNTFKDE